MNRFDRWWMRNSARIGVGFLVWAVAFLAYLVMYGGSWWGVAFGVLSVVAATKSLHAAFELRASGHDLELLKARIKWERDLGDDA
jgi:hypothetical protein